MLYLVPLIQKNCSQHFDPVRKKIASSASKKFPQCLLQSLVSSNILHRKEVS